MNVAISVDLDGTLIKTQHHYDKARDQFAQFISEQFEDITTKEASENQSSHSYDLLGQYGLSKDRFPQACVESYKDLTGEESSEDIEKVRSIGEEAFKSVDEYQQIGFMDNAEQMVERFASLSDHLILLTAGDKEVQNRKIKALSLENKFDNTEIVPMNGKKEVLIDLSAVYDEVIHVGNSESSDVQAAAEAEVNCAHIPREEWMGHEVDFPTTVTLRHFEDAQDANKRFEEEYDFL